jgi:hypothetical protein
VIPRVGFRHRIHSFDKRADRRLLAGIKGPVSGKNVPLATIQSKRCGMAGEQIVNIRATRRDPRS